MAKVKVRGQNAVVGGTSYESSSSVLHGVYLLRTMICKCKSLCIQDLLRTMPGNACFCNINSTGIPRLRRVLRAIAWLYLDVGYCQGTGMVRTFVKYSMVLNALTQCYLWSPVYHTLPCIVVKLFKICWHMYWNVILSHDYLEIVVRFFIDNCGRVCHILISFCIVLHLFSRRERLEINSFLTV